jgi:hypothetical protein
LRVEDAQALTGDPFCFDVFSWGGSVGLVGKKLHDRDLASASLEEIKE